MKENRLTYYQICTLVAQKLPIPKEYNIKYSCGLEPRKVIDETLDDVNNTIYYQRNTFPFPDQVKICGEQKVVIPQPKCYDDEVDNSEDDLVDFGDVYIQTEFYLSALNFKYKFERQEEVTRKLNELTDSVSSDRGYVRKSDFTFDVNIKLTNETLSIKDAMPESADFGKMNEYPKTQQVFQKVCAAVQKHYQGSKLVALLTYLCVVYAVSPRVTEQPIEHKRCQPVKRQHHQHCHSQQTQALCQSLALCLGGGLLKVALAVNIGVFAGVVNKAVTVRVALFGPPLGELSVVVVELVLIGLFLGNIYQIFFLILQAVHLLFRYSISHFPPD